VPLLCYLFMSLQRSAEYRPLRYKSLRPLPPPARSPDTQPRRGGGAGGTPSPGPKAFSPAKSGGSYSNSKGDLFGRSGVPSARPSLGNGVLLCKLSAREMDAAGDTLQVPLSQPIVGLNNLHQRQALLVREAFDTAEGVVKQCTIARYRCHKNPTSVNQKRLEVLSVRSVRVVLGSIEKVDEVCHLLRNNYSKNAHSNSSGVGGAEASGGQGGGGGGGPRAQSAPGRRPPLSLGDAPRTEAGPRARPRRAGERPQSAFSRRARSQSRGASTPASRLSSAQLPYRNFSTRIKQRKDMQRASSVSARPPDKGGSPSTRRVRPESGQEDGDRDRDRGKLTGYSDDGTAGKEDAAAAAAADTLDPSDAEPAPEERGRGRHRIIRKVKKKKSKGPKHTCAQCSEQFFGECKFYYLLLLFKLLLVYGTVFSFL
jgi:hypothetical protein